MSTSRTLLCALFLAAIGGGTARADYVAYGNLANAPSGYDAVASAPRGLGPLGQSFSSTGGAINDVTIGLFNGGDAGSVIVTLNADSGHAPGSIVATLGTVADTSIGSAMGSMYTFTGLNLMLTAGTTYWIEVRDSYTGNIGSLKTNVRWASSNDASGIGISGQYVFASYGTSGPVGGTNPLIMQVDAPEPATLTVLGIGIAGLGWARRRRQKKGASQV